MVDKFSQVASNIPAANADTNKQYLVINGYPVVFSFSNEPNPEAFERIEALQRFILGAFQIQSTNTSVRSIAADAEFIRRTVYYRADGLRKAGK